MHISKAESKKVSATRKKLYGKRSALALATTARNVPAYGSPCQGRSGTVEVNANETHKYYNSCETVDLVYYWGGCIGGMAFIGRFTKKNPAVDLSRYFIGAFCGYQAARIRRAADKSQIGAIFVRTYKQEAYQPYPAGVRYSIQSSFIPQ